MPYLKSHHTAACTYDAELIIRLNFSHLSFKCQVHCGGELVHSQASSHYTQRDTVHLMLKHCLAHLDVFH